MQYRPKASQKGRVATHPGSEEPVARGRRPAREHKAAAEIKKIEKRSGHKEAGLRTPKICCSKTQRLADREGYEKSAYPAERRLRIREEKI